MDCALSPSSRDTRLFRLALLRWYDLEKRDLPWRKTKDPYQIWVSEIMLQQTRVGAVLEHYREFLGRFPDVETLAGARLDAVLAAWSGLGYYRRARNLHAAAQKVIAELDGEIPRAAEALRGLPGIGRYTAAAIASIAFGERCAVLDGNVERVLQRVHGHREMSAGELWTAAEDLLSPQRPGDFNQAMMELGATICLPGEPRCLLCPIRSWCRTRGALSSTKQTKRTICDLDVALIIQGERVKLVRRPTSETVMTGMWELPTLPTPPDGFHEPGLSLKHSIMNTDYKVRVWRLPRRASPRLPAGRWFPLKEVSELPLTGLARKILHRLKLT
jgi:A/G-specific adenine glycosylase